MVTKEIAMEVYNLKEGYSKSDIKNSYRRLVKIAHPDTGGDKALFEFILKCNDILENGGGSTNDGSKSKKHNNQQVKTYKMSLGMLYDEYVELDYITRKYNLQRIYTNITIRIYPYFHKDLVKIFSFEVGINFQGFKNANTFFVEEDVNVPKEFKKYNMFRAEVKIFDDERNHGNFSVLFCKNKIKTFTVGTYSYFNSYFKLSFKK